ncbi:hypothetical protein [Salinarimonas soli]|uniref:Uncharacterized protein n=1 Tax=Salinarimonas soli TaxID=1638099 RepID=A0A5B2VFJ5_9HYPH|nr:hypothetical protein [Salinarimonas soli]KAA2237069.1 hypothetical protein F0L46_11430 [Salinarimonas soli]
MTRQIWTLLIVLLAALSAVALFWVWGIVRVGSRLCEIATIRDQAPAASLWWCVEHYVNRYQILATALITVLSALFVGALLFQQIRRTEVQIRTAAKQTGVMIQQADASAIEHLHRRALELRELDDAIKMSVESDEQLTHTARAAKEAIDALLAGVGGDSSETVVSLNSIHNGRVDPRLRISKADQRLKELVTEAMLPPSLVTSLSSFNPQLSSRVRVHAQIAVELFDAIESYRRGDLAKVAQISRDLDDLYDSLTGVKLKELASMVKAGIYAKDAQSRFEASLNRLNDTATR